MGSPPLLAPRVRAPAVASTSAAVMPLLNVVVRDKDKTRRLRLPETCTAADVAQALEKDVALPPERQRLIANGRELEPHECLVTVLGEFYFRSKHITLKELDTDACREWQRCGRCKAGSGCTKSFSHTSEWSPRYVAYEHLDESGSSASPADSPAATPPQTPPPHTPPQSHSIVNGEAQQRVCRNWANEGSCRFGAQCHFAASHTPQNVPWNAFQEPHAMMGDLAGHVNAMDIREPAHHNARMEIREPLAIREPPATPDQVGGHVIPQHYTTPAHRPAPMLLSSPHHGDGAPDATFHQGAQAYDHRGHNNMMPQQPMMQQPMMAQPWDGPPMGYGMAPQQQPPHQHQGYHEPPREHAVYQQPQQGAPMAGAWNGNPGWWGQPHVH